MKNENFSSFASVCIMLISRIPLVMASMATMVIAYSLVFQFAKAQLLVHFNYELIVTDNMLTAIFTLSGACIVAFIALHGVMSQNRSNEQRHKSDKEISLRKEVILAAAEVLAKQHDYLLSFIENPEMNSTDRVKITQGNSQIFAKMFVVCSLETNQMLAEATEEYQKAIIKLTYITNTLKGSALLKSQDERLIFSIRALPLINDYHKKALRFANCCKKEFGYDDDSEEFVEKLSAYFERLPDLITTTFESVAITDNQTKE